MLFLTDIVIVIFSECWKLGPLFKIRYGILFTLINGIWYSTKRLTRRCSRLVSLETNNFLPREYFCDNTVRQLQGLVLVRYFVSMTVKIILWFVLFSARDVAHQWVDKSCLLVIQLLFISCRHRRHNVHSNVNHHKQRL